MMRIISGRHRSRKLEIPESENIRPTTDKVREALFSMLTHRLGSWEGARVLDACCGSGAFGLEAISRGAAHVCFMDNAHAALTLARRNAATLKEQEKCHFMAADMTMPSLATTPYDVILMDPPYNKGLAEAGLAALTAARWAAPAALAAVEVARDEGFTPPPGWKLVVERSHGPAKLLLLERQVQPSAVMP